MKMGSHAGKLYIEKETLKFCWKAQFWMPLFLVNNPKASEKDKVEIPVTNFVFLRRAMHSSQSCQVEFVNISKI